MKLAARVWFGGEDRDYRAAVSEVELTADSWPRAYTIEDGIGGMTTHVTLLYPFADDNVLVAEPIRAQPMAERVRLVLGRA